MVIVVEKEFAILNMAVSTWVLVHSIFQSDHSLLDTSIWNPKHSPDDDEPDNFGKMSTWDLDKIKTSVVFISCCTSYKKFVTCSENHGKK